MASHLPWWLYELHVPDVIGPQWMSTHPLYMRMEPPIPIRHLGVGLEAGRGEGCVVSLDGLGVSNTSMLVREMMGHLCPDRLPR